MSNVILPLGLTNYIRGGLVKVKETVENIRGLIFFKISNITFGVHREDIFYFTEYIPIEPKTISFPVL